MLFKKKINLLVILLWNSDRDYFTFKNKIISLEKKFKVQLLSVSNFSKNIYFPLNNFKIKRKPSLISISGIRLLKRIKYNFPLIHGLYNFIKYFNVVKIFFSSSFTLIPSIKDKLLFLRTFKTAFISFLSYTALS